jgi:hypothetical protein
LNWTFKFEENGVKSETRTLHLIGINSPGENLEKMNEREGKMIIVCRR